MTKENLKRPVYLCGDIHGEWREFVWTAIEKYKIRDADIIILGDFGIGFDNAMDNLYARTEKKLEEADIMVYTLRGNHDDPFFFREENSYPRLKFLEDGKVYTIGGQELLIMGGGNSTDISWRLEENQKLASRGSSKRVWWEGEDITRIPLKELPARVDVVLSHEAPLIFEPVAKRFPDTPPEQYDKILAGRKYLDEVLQRIRCNYWFYGHYHDHYSGEYAQTMYRGLGIMEFYELPEKKNLNPQIK